MNIFKTRIFTLSTSIALGTALFSASAIASTVESVSLEVFRDTKQPFWEVAVVCADTQESLTMQKPVADKLWCSSTEQKLCNENKFTLSEAICGDNSAVQTAVASESKATDTLKASSKQNVSVVKEQNTPSKNAANNFLAADGYDRQALLREKMQVEEQQIQIQQKRLELRRQELNLKRRQIEG